MKSPEIRGKQEPLNKREDVIPARPGSPQGSTIANANRILARRGNMAVRARLRYDEKAAAIFTAVRQTAHCLGAAPQRRWLSAPVLEQTARDDLRLDLGRTLEDVQNARIAKHAADRILQRETVTAMNLQRVVGVGPSDAGA